MNYLALPSKEDIHTAILLSAETAFVDFKSEFHPSDKGSFLEVLKDMAAMANSGGGIILIGLDNNGTPNGFSPEECLVLDPAKITDALYKFTDRQFNNFELVKLIKNDLDVFAILIGGTPVPLVFSQTGNYAEATGKQKDAFRGGMVYFRHGAKSEAGNSEDLRDFIEKRLQAVRTEWLTGIAKVVEAPTGSVVRIIEPGQTEASPLMALSFDPSAKTLPVGAIDKLWPHRQKEVVAKVNEVLGEKKKINAAHIQYVRKAYDTNSNSAFCYQQDYASPKYSDAFVDWIISKFGENADFFEDAKAMVDAKKAQPIVHET